MRAKRYLKPVSRTCRSRSRLSQAVRDIGYMHFEIRGLRLSMRFLCVLPPSIISWLICLISREIVFLHASVSLRNLCIATALLRIATPLRSCPACDLLWLWSSFLISSIPSLTPQLQSSVYISLVQQPTPQISSPCRL